MQQKGIFKLITASLFGLLTLFIFPIINNSAHAESSSTQASLEIDSIINISAPPTVTLNCTPGATDAQAELCTSTANVIVTTNNITGYTLQMNATSGSPTALTNSAASPAATIPTLSQAYPSANFPINSWGYTGGLDKSSETGGYDCSTNYCPILAYESDPENYSPNHIINQTDAPSTASTTSITFAGKVNTTKPSGTYSTFVTFTAITNAPPDYTARLDTGQTVNAKLKSLAAGTTQTYNDSDYLIKSIDVHLETPAPTGFIPSEANTISSSESKNPIYIIFDNTNDAGIMHFYTEGNQIFLPSDSSYMFNEFRSLSDLSDLSDWNTSNVTDMSWMFALAGRSAATTFTLNLSDWNTSNVTNMSYMFYSAGYSATTFTLDLSDWNTSNVTNMSFMFYCAGYNATTFTLDLSDWNTSSVTDMSHIFEYTGRFATTWSIGDLSDWNTSSVTDMSRMFSSAGRSATTWSIGDLSDWDTSNVTDMSGMFFEAGYSATTFTLDLSDWNTSNVTDMSYMFSNVGRSATTWSVTIPPTNGNNISNTTSNMYGQTTSVYGEPPSGKSFTLAQ
ncbi:BspA family leucine-rich repeat surface protein [Candidatus Saccharibacteria bacterium]|nr:BspA family leucine-rich repeat surface protein [Candidatus Saccharibacteria bacterium]